jgi:hypothetical protein
MPKHWPPKGWLQIGFPNLMVSLIFQPLGPIQGHKVQHLLVAWGRLNFIFSISAFTPSVKQAFVSMDFDLILKTLTRVWFQNKNWTQVPFMCETKTKTKIVLILFKTHLM